MVEPNLFTWILLVFGMITLLPLIAAQTVLLRDPESRRAKDLIIGKGREWRNSTHRKSAIAFAWSDILLVLPLFIIGSTAVLSGASWGYLLWIALGFICVYFSINFWVMERATSVKYHGWFAYLTYYWGFFLYWGVGVIIYSFLQLSNMIF
jgi:hypothetical protein